MRLSAVLKSTLRATALGLRQAKIRPTQQVWNMRMSKRVLRPILVLLLCAACNPVRGCPESTFSLAADSRLPRWFALPSGYVRQDVTVRLTYYVPPVPVDDVVMELMNLPNNRMISKLTGKACWHPRIDRIQRNSEGGFTQGSEPRYTIVRAAGIVEVIDHFSKDPIFRITDDPVLVQEANESLQRGECRKG
jgi:hypothetical protein